MKLAGGRVTLAVPADWMEGETDIILSVSDASGQEVFHTFKLTFDAKDAPAEEKPAPDVKPNPKPEPEPKPKPEPKPEPNKPAVVQDKEAVKTLPDSISAVTVGGGGRFIILHLAKLRKIAVYDVHEGKIAGYIAQAEDNLFMAAGMDKLMIALPDKKIIQRWNLKTLEREVAAPLPVEGKVTGLCMGSASQGPLLVAGAATLIVRRPSR